MLEQACQGGNVCWLSSEYCTTSSARFYFISNNVYLLYFSTGCWDLKPGYNAVKGMVDGELGWEDRPTIFFFGNLTSFTQCKETCGMEPGCYAVTLNGPDGTKWVNTCYGRGFGVAEKLPQQMEKYSAVKIC